MMGETSRSTAIDKLKDCANRFLGSSLYALCFRSRVQLGRTTLSSTSLLDNLSRQSLANQQPLGRMPWRGRVAFRHKVFDISYLTHHFEIVTECSKMLCDSFPVELNFGLLMSSYFLCPIVQLDQHQILLEAAYHECFLDRESGYWEVPQTVSADVASRGALGGLRYRVGVHHSAGTPLRCVEEAVLKVPQGTLPGLRIQAAVSLEKSVNLWKGESNRSLKKSYSFLEARPCICLSGVLGNLTVPISIFFDEMRNDAFFFVSLQ